MRVIGGRFRSRLLTAPRGAATRPTSDRLRETLFNILSPRMDGARFVDLYAGTGAVGIEAVSRGAAQVWMAERAEPALKAIRANLKALGIAEGRAGASAASAGEVTVEARGTVALLERLARAAERNSRESASGAVDVVYLDPPWEAEQEYARTLEFLGSERGRAMLAGDAMVIAEHSVKKRLAERYGMLVRTRELKHGDAGLSFYAADAKDGLLERFHSRCISNPLTPARFPLKENRTARFEPGPQ